MKRKEIRRKLKLQIIKGTVFVNNKIEGTPILKLAMVKRLQVKKFPIKVPYIFIFP